MKKKRRTEITFETHEVTVIRFSRNKKTDFCRACRSHTRHLSVAESASVLALPEAAIFRLAENGQIHAHETAEGSLWLCGNSLADLAKE